MAQFKGSNHQYDLTQEDEVCINMYTVALNRNLSLTRLFDSSLSSMVWKRNFHS